MYLYTTSLSSNIVRKLPLDNNGFHFIFPVNLQLKILQQWCFCNFSFLVIDIVKTKFCEFSWKNLFCFYWFLMLLLKNILHLLYLQLFAPIWQFISVHLFGLGILVCSWTSFWRYYEYLIYNILILVNPISIKNETILVWYNYT